jgi:virginiamycin A acetyltransferase
LKNLILPFKAKIADLLYRAYSINIRPWRSVILRMVKSLEGGELYSSTLRRIYSSYHNIRIGLYSYGGCFSADNILPGTEIGRYCSFARNVYVYTRNHPYNHKSTHPFFYNSQLNLVGKNLIPTSKVVIGNDVWIGMNAIILPSVTRIGDGAVIGAGSIVTKEVPPYAIVAGNPARIIKYRFDQDKIEQLLQSKWWDESIDDLKGMIGSFVVPLK